MGRKYKKKVQWRRLSLDETATAPSTETGDVPDNSQYRTKCYEQNQRLQQNNQWDPYNQYKYIDTSQPLPPPGFYYPPTHLQRWRSHDEGEEYGEEELVFHNQPVNTVFINNEAYTKIQTPRQEVIFKKSSLTKKRGSVDNDSDSPSDACQDDDVEGEHATYQSVAYDVPDGNQFCNGDPANPQLAGVVLQQLYPGGPQVTIPVHWASYINPCFIPGDPALTSLDPGLTRVINADEVFPESTPLIPTQLDANGEPISVQVQVDENGVPIEIEPKGFPIYRCSLEQCTQNTFLEQNEPTFYDDNEHNTEETNEKPEETCQDNINLKDTEDSGSDSQYASMSETSSPTTPAGELAEQNTTHSTILETKSETLKPVEHITPEPPNDIPVPVDVVPEPEFIEVVSKKHKKSKLKPLIATKETPVLADPIEPSKKIESKPKAEKKPTNEKSSKSKGKNTKQQKPKQKKSKIKVKCKDPVVSPFSGNVYSPSFENSPASQKNKLSSIALLQAGQLSVQEYLGLQSTDVDLAQIDTEMVICPIEGFGHIDITQLDSLNSDSSSATGNPVVHIKDDSAGVANTSISTEDVKDSVMQFNDNEKSESVSDPTCKEVPNGQQQSEVEKDEVDSVQDTEVSTDITEQIVHQTSSEETEEINTLSHEETERITKVSHEEIEEITEFGSEEAGETTQLTSEETGETTQLTSDETGETTQLTSGEMPKLAAVETEKIPKLTAVETEEIPNIESDETFQIKIEKDSISDSILDKEKVKKVELNPLSEEFSSRLDNDIQVSQEPLDGPCDRLSEDGCDEKNTSQENELCKQGYVIVPVLTPYYDPAVLYGYHMVVPEEPSGKSLSRRRRRKYKKKGQDNHHISNQYDVNKYAGETYVAVQDRYVIPVDSSHCQVHGARQYSHSQVHVDEGFLSSENSSKICENNQNPFESSDFKSENFTKLNDTERKEVVEILQDSTKPRNESGDSGLSDADDLTKIKKPKSKKSKPKSTDNVKGDRKKKQKTDPPKNYIHIEEPDFSKSTPFANSLVLLNHEEEHKKENVERNNRNHKKKGRHGSKSQVRDKKSLSKRPKYTPQVSIDESLFDGDIDMNAVIETSAIDKQGGSELCDNRVVTTVKDKDINLQAISSAEDDSHQTQLSQIVSETESSEYTQVNVCDAPADEVSNEIVTETELKVDSKKLHASDTGDSVGTQVCEFAASIESACNAMNDDDIVVKDYMYSENVSFNETGVSIVQLGNCDLDIPEGVAMEVHVSDCKNLKETADSNKSCEDPEDISIVYTDPENIIDVCKNLKDTSSDCTDFECTTNACTDPEDTSIVYTHHENINVCTNPKNTNHVCKDGEDSINACKDGEGTDTVCNESEDTGTVCNESENTGTVCNESEDTGTVCNESEDTGTVCNESEDTGTVCNESEDTGAVCNESEDTGAVCNESEDTGAVCNESEDTGAVCNESEDTGAVCNESEDAGTVCNESEDAGTVCNESEDAGTVCNESEDAGTVCNESEDAGTVCNESEDTGTVCNESEDTGTVCNESEDTGTVCNESEDTGTVCNESEDTGTVCNGSEDTGTVCNGSEDTGTVCNGSEDTGTVCNGSEDTGTVCNGSEDTGTVSIDFEETGTVSIDFEDTGTVCNGPEDTGTVSIDFEETGTVSIDFEDTGTVCNGPEDTSIVCNDSEDIGSVCSGSEDSDTVCNDFKDTINICNDSEELTETEKHVVISSNVTEVSTCDKITADFSLRKQIVMESTLLPDTSLEDVNEGCGSDNSSGSVNNSSEGGIVAYDENMPFSALPLTTSHLKTIEISQENDFNQLHDNHLGNKDSTSFEEPIVQLEYDGLLLNKPSDLVQEPPTLDFIKLTSLLPSIEEEPTESDESDSDMFDDIPCDNLGVTEAVKEWVTKVNPSNLFNVSEEMKNFLQVQSIQTTSDVGAVNESHSKNVMGNPLTVLSSKEHGVRVAESENCSDYLAMDELADPSKYDPLVYSKYYNFGVQIDTAENSERCSLCSSLEEDRTTGDESNCNHSMLLSKEVDDELPSSRISNNESSPHTRAGVFSPTFSSGLGSSLATTPVQSPSRLSDCKSVPHPNNEETLPCRTATSSCAIM